MIAFLVTLWLLGLFGHIGGALIHLLLVVAAIMLIFQLTAGRPSRGLAGPRRL
ncbi:MAG TPA: lmo0937 family membrane protein, partial [Blastocatellia bacterium]|nr:lmo0937 family membrane protein [Blastocatellia bacterium]